MRWFVNWNKVWRRWTVFCFNRKLIPPSQSWVLPSLPIGVACPESTQLIKSGQCLESVGGLWRCSCRDVSRGNCTIKDLDVTPRNYRWTWSSRTWSQFPTTSETKPILSLSGSNGGGCHAFLCHRLTRLLCPWSPVWEDYWGWAFDSSFAFRIYFHSC